MSDKFKILALTSDPTDIARLRLGKEMRIIREYLHASERRDRIELFERHAVRPGDIVQALFEVAPNVVHFSGHGTKYGELCFEDELGRVSPVDPSAAEALFERFAGQIICVVLNSCYSETQAKAIVKSIRYVVGMKDVIGDEAAIHFAGGFYRALGAGQSIEESFQFGLVELQLHRLKAMAQHPVLLRNPALSPRHVLVRPRPIQYPDGSSVFSTPPIPGCAHIYLDRKDHAIVFVDPERYATVGELGDELFMNYLSSRFPINSYGSNWVLQESRYQIAAPLEWAERGPCPLEELDTVNWKYSTTPKEQLIIPSSSWRVRRITPSDKFIGLAFKSERALRARTWDKSRWVLVKMLDQVRFEDIDMSQYPYKFVFRNDFDRQTKGILAETSPLTEKQLRFIGPLSR